VIIERFDPALDIDSEKRLFGLARCASPFIQRALAYDRKSSVAVFEAPNGAPLADAFAKTPSQLTIAHLLKRLGQALAPLHALGHAHGALHTSTVVVDNHGFPTILVSGLPAVTGALTADGDTSAAIALIADVAECQRTWPALVGKLAGAQATSPAMRALAASEPRTGEQLLAAGSQLEIACASRQARGPESPP
jgi:hypothetical protein